MAKKKKKKQNDTSLPRDVWGLILVACSLVVLVSLYSFAYAGPRNMLGITGQAIGWALHAAFGQASYLIPLFILWFGWRFLFDKPVNAPGLKLLYMGTLLLSSSLLLNLLELEWPILGSKLAYKGVKFHLGGAPFYYIYHDLPWINLHAMVNVVGTTLVGGTLFLGSFYLLTKWTLWRWIPSWEWVPSPLPVAAAHAPKIREEPKTTEPTESAFMRYVKLRAPDLEVEPEAKPVRTPRIVSAPKEKEKEPPRPPRSSLFNHYTLPSPQVLTNAKKIDQSSLKKDLKRQAEVLEEALRSFSIEARVGQINCGPTITSFEVHPAVGVKVQKIKTLENDIALNMEAKSIRIIAPIPGKAAVGVEVPNPQPQEVGFKEMLQAYQEGTQRYKIPILLGKAVNGDYVMADLAKMPHCIIAGATGSGKSVCINTIVMSIVMNHKPDEIRLMMVDPKKVELTGYSKLPHMLAPVITEPGGACAALNWLVKEMENRYEILKLLGVRNIEAFNNRKPNPGAEQNLGREIPAHMAYYVGIIDELADLMMVASQDIETPIARIAQMARAVGIHLVLATQRPSREVITGLIKANFPTRIAFKVASRINSQIILDEVGAETLLGNGDMLFLPPGTSHLIRAQGAYIRDEDINTVIQIACEQAPVHYLIDNFDRMPLPNKEGGGDKAPGDELYDTAVDTVLSTGNASTTFLQRKLKVGYARAASLIDLMEQRGIVGPSEGAKPRKILASHRTQGDLFEDD